MYHDQSPYMMSPRRETSTYVGRNNYGIGHHDPRNDPMRTSHQGSTFNPLAGGTSRISSMRQSYNPPGKGVLNYHYSRDSAGHHPAIFAEERKTGPMYVSQNIPEGS